MAESGLCHRRVGAKMKKNTLIIVLIACLWITAGWLTINMITQYETREIKAKYIENRGVSWIAREDALIRRYEDGISLIDEFELNEEMALKLGYYAIVQAYGNGDETKCWGFYDTLIIRETSDKSCFIIMAEAPIMRKEGVIIEDMVCAVIDKKTAEIITIGL